MGGREGREGGVGGGAFGAEAGLNIPKGEGEEEDGGRQGGEVARLTTSSR